MPRGKKFADIRRSLIRRLDGQNTSVIRELRDELWQRLIARQFFSGYSVDSLAGEQPNWSSRQAIERAIRDQANKRRKRSF